MNELETLMVDVAARTGAGRGVLETIAEAVKRVTPYSSQTVEEGLAVLARQLEQVRVVSQAQIETVAENTQAIAQNAQAQASKGSSTIADIAKGASAVLGGGLALTPLLSGLIGLFRREKSEPPPSLVSYVQPPARQVEGVLPEISGQPVLAADYGQNGIPRPVQPGGASYSPQITVQVQAMDSRSFLDHSTEIARAVREAMLSAHPLNDMINEL
jgi:hypothetical protein